MLRAVITTRSLFVLLIALLILRLLSLLNTDYLAASNAATDYLRVALAAANAGLPSSVVTSFSHASKVAGLFLIHSFAAT